MTDDRILPGPGHVPADDDEPDLGPLAELLRTTAGPPQPVDLVARVQGAVAAGLDETAEDQLVDDLYDGGSESAAAADPALARLQEVVRTGARLRREPDLLPRIHDRLEADRISRRQRVIDLDPSTRWRIWTAVIGGHVAALLALAALHVTVRPMGGEDGAVASRPDATAYLIDTQRLGDGAGGELALADLPKRWSGFRHHPELLFALRNSPDRREAARKHFGSDGSARTVASALVWLQDQAEDDSAEARLAQGAPQQRLAASGLAALALLGEGLDDGRRRLAVLALLKRIDDDLAAIDPATADMRCLAIVACARVEAAVLFDDDRLRSAAAASLADLERRQFEAGPAGLGGFALLAVRSARIAGIAIPAGLDKRVERELARPLPERGADAGRRGLAAFARVTEGGRNSASLADQVGHLRLAAPGLDRERRADVAAWLFPTLALREVGDPAWHEWNDALHGALLRSFRYGEAGLEGGIRAWIPGERVVSAEALGSQADIYATALAVIQLQAAYRYLPLAANS